MDGVDVAAFRHWHVCCQRHLPFLPALVIRDAGDVRVDSDVDISATWKRDGDATGQCRRLLFGIKMVDVCICWTGRFRRVGTLPEPFRH